ncbi:MAG: helix-turn-helix transcriptional regulator [Pyrobaculum sp.]
MSVRLTRTEKKIAELYTTGMRPREIAEHLGVSINTVYKALSKARRAAEVSTEAPAPIGTSHTTYIYTTYLVLHPPGGLDINIYSAVRPDVNTASQDIYKTVLQRLDEILDVLRSLKKSVEIARHVENNGRLHTDATDKNGDGHLSEFLKRNAWISILRSKA